MAGHESDASGQNHLQRVDVRKLIMPLLSWVESFDFDGVSRKICRV
jgi:hypothetical protein